MAWIERHGALRRGLGGVRDWAINKEVDVTHLLSPMTLSLMLGAGSPAMPYLMPVVEHINGQGITLTPNTRECCGRRI